ncbi:MAG: FAD:protein FMN transferase, partial [Kiritimatiellaeota bacterium]|nr:FAD:protein FMN transferase [Kiritimatiellota bacterium]
KHHAMATEFQVRIADEDATYAGQAAQELFTLVDRMNDLLSRFRENSEISQIAALLPGMALPLNAMTFDCLRLARSVEELTSGAFAITATAKREPGAPPPRWRLEQENLLIHCEEGKLEFALLAELAEWECGAFLLIAGGSSVLAGAAPAGTSGWDAGLGLPGGVARRFALTHGSLGGSGIYEQGRHIIDPRTGQPAQGRDRAWAFAKHAALSDALSTAAMVLTDDELHAALSAYDEACVVLGDGGTWRTYGDYPLPPEIPAAPPANA